MPRGTNMQVVFSSTGINISIGLGTLSVALMAQWLRSSRTSRHEKCTHKLQPETGNKNPNRFGSSFKFRKNMK
jgi:hypothetical protein